MTARATLLRRGRDTAHVASDVYAGAGRLVATGFLTYWIGPHGETVHNDVGCVPLVDDGQSWSSPPKRMSGSPYGRAAGIEVLEERDYQAALRIPLAENEGAGGCVHEGAIAGLIDNCGAFSSYTHPQVPFNNRGSTVAMYVSYVDSVAGDLRAFARLVARSGHAFTSQVEVRGASSKRLAALASVSYRIPA